MMKCRVVWIRGKPGDCVCSSTYGFGVLRSRVWNQDLGSVRATIWTLTQTLCTVETCLPASSRSKSVQQVHTNLSWKVLTLLKYSWSRNTTRNTINTCILLWDDAQFYFQRSTIIFSLIGPKFKVPQWTYVPVYSVYPIASLTVHSILTTTSTTHHIILSVHTNHMCTFSVCK